MGPLICNSKHLYFVDPVSIYRIPACTGHYTGDDYPLLFFDPMEKENDPADRRPGPGKPAYPGL